MKKYVISKKRADGSVMNFDEVFNYELDAKFTLDRFMAAKSTARRIDDTTWINHIGKSEREIFFVKAL